MESEKVEVEFWNLSIPLTPPLKAGRGLITNTYVLLIFVADRNGNRGIGYSSFRGEAELDQATHIAKDLAAKAGFHLPGLINVERLESNGASTSQLTSSRSAANALSLAAWDFAGKRSNSTCADLWGRPPNRNSIECYASAFWLDKSIDQLKAEAKEHKQRNYKLVKMRVGKSIPDSLERIAAVQEVYREPRTIALETGFGWTVDLTNQFLKEAPGEYLWIEDPVSYEKMGSIDKKSRNSVGAGEKCEMASELFKLYMTGGIRKIILDVQYLGGPVRFLEAARSLNALGATVGAHRFSHYSIHLLASLPKSLPIEMLDWTNPALIPISGPDKSGECPVLGPGFSIALNQSVIDDFGRRI
ncbi:MAG: Mandelate racemase [Nitrosomonadaceae bacterium]|nr:Mandelate racemase [Nitrosomonadaceae bacterium]